jgi:hypothetical protein
MLNLRKRIKDLQEKTASLEAKAVCVEIVENFVNVGDDQLSSFLVEKLRKVEDADKHVEKFIRISDKISAVNDLGVSRSIGRIKESQIYSYPALKYGLNKIENSIVNLQVPEYVAIDEMIGCLKTFVWDSTVNESYNELKESRERLAEDIEISQSIYHIKRSKGNFIYDVVLEKLEDHFCNPTQSSRSSILEDLRKFSFSPVTRRLSESLAKFQRKETSGVQLVSENSKSAVHSVYSPLLLENGGEYFFVRGNFFRKNNGSIEKITETSALPEKFREICRIISSPSVFIKEGKVSFYAKRNKVEILENEGAVEVRFNGSKIPSKDLAKHMVSAGLFRLEESQMAYDVQSIVEGFSNIYDIDFVKVVESNIHKGSYAILMKEGENIYVNKVNESQRSNEFFSGLNATQARNMILEFIGFDIKESLSEYLEKDEAHLKSLKESQLELVKNLTIVEANYNKVINALQDPSLSSSPDLQSVKTMLEEEMVKLKNKHRSVSEDIRAFEKKTISDMGYEVGDNVKVIDSGESATINSIDSTRGVVNIITSGGRTMDVAVSKITSLEGSEKQAEEKNMEDGQKKN